MSMELIDLHLRPEFTYELVLGVPYAKWLHDNRKLGTVYTSKGMSPYYYFAHSVVEQYDERTINNDLSGVKGLPNNWLHHNAMAIFGRDYSQLTEEEKIQANGVLDYSQWTPPDYATEFGRRYLYISKLFKKPIIIINNQYNIEKGLQPTRFYDIECLYTMIEMLKDKYQIVYNRPKNTEFVVDENEVQSRGMELVADVEGIGRMTDYDLIKRYPGEAFLFNELLDEENLSIENYNKNLGEREWDSWMSAVGSSPHRKFKLSYNEFQLRLFGRAHGFIGLVGGAGSLSCFYKKPTIMYESVSRAVAPGYWSPDSYYQMLSNQNAYPVIDKREDQLARGGHDYSKLYELIERLFL